MSLVQKQQLTKEQQKIMETLEKLLKMKPEDRERLLRIVTTNPPQKIVLALNQLIIYDNRTGKVKRKPSLDEFERKLRKIRF